MDTKQCQFCGAPNNFNHPMVLGYECETQVNAQGWHQSAKCVKAERDQLKEKVAVAKKALEHVVNSAAHPEIALRVVMVDLKPIRAALKKL